MEAAKSRSMSELIFQSGQSLPMGDSGQSELVRRIRGLREELNWYYHRIELEQLRPGDQRPKMVEELQAQAKAREKEFLRALRQIPSPESEDPGFGGYEPVTLDSIRSALAADTVLLEYFRVREHIVAALITRETLEVIPLTLASRVGNPLPLSKFHLSKFRLDPVSARPFAKTLLKPTQSTLTDPYQNRIP